MVRLPGVAGLKLQALTFESPLQPRQGRASLAFQPRGGSSRRWRVQQCKAPEEGGGVDGVRAPLARASALSKTWRVVGVP